MSAPRSGGAGSAAPHPTPDHEAHLRSVIGVRALSAEIVNLIIGAGIFALPAVAAEQLGSHAWIAYVVCAAAMALVLLCFAIEGSRVTTSGGPYAYVHAAFGTFPAFLIGVLLWVAAAVSSAAVATVFADTLGTVFPVAASGMGHAAALLMIYGIAVLVNVYGVQQGSRTVTGFTMAKLLPLVGLVLVVGILLMIGHIVPGVRGATVGAVPPPNSTIPVTEHVVTVGTVGRTALVLIFAFLGAEVALAPSGEVRRPNRTVPLAIGVALGVVTVLYLSLQATAQVVLGPALADDPSIRAAPLAAVGTRLFGPAGALVLTLAALVSTAGYVLGDVLASPRVLFALAADGHFPKFLARVHQTYDTPAVAIVIHGTVAALLAASGTFATLVILNNVAILVLYLVCCLAALVLLRRERARHGLALVKNDEAGEEAPFTVPFGPLIPVLACGVMVWLLTQAEPREFAAVGAALVIAALAYGFQHRSRGENKS